MSVFYELEPNFLVFDCPGCGYSHNVTVNGRKNESGACWKWNGDKDKPTISPSILVWSSRPEARCHSFIKDGKIQFLNDCFHDLKGQTVALPNCSWEEDDE